MENIPTEDVEVDGNGREVSQYCLGLPTILRKVLEQFSSKDLIDLSLVNKLWNFEARSVMRERGNVIGNLWSGGVQPIDPCQRLVAFASDLETMIVVPFSGISFKICHRKDCVSISDGSLDPSYQVILDRLPWKHFSVAFRDRNWDSCKNCPALVLVRRILEDYCGVLEELTVRNGRESFLESIFQGQSFPRLKSLDIHSAECGTADPSWTSTSIKALVASAPNLQELLVNDRVDLTVNILEGRSAVLVPTTRFEPLRKPMYEGLIGSIRAESMEVYIHSEEFDLELLNQFMPKVLEASRSTLQTLIMDYLFFVPLMCYGICLENVTTLQIQMNFYLTDDVELSILKLPTGLDFTRIFPKLNQVDILNNFDEIELSSDPVGAFIEQGNAVLNRALPDRAVNIKLLKIDLCESVEEFLPLLAQIFPDIKTVELLNDRHEYSLAQLREHFLHLEELTECVPEYHF